MNREEHLQWCKDRALKYLVDTDDVDASDIAHAFASMSSDLTKPPETNSPSLAKFKMIPTLGRQIGTVHQMRSWINGFN